MAWLRHRLGYEVTAPVEKATVDKRLEAQQLRLNALDAAIQAQNAAIPRRVERRRVPRL
jgi:hypothetical protein